MYRQHANAPHRLYETFNAAVDEFFSTAESQKIELRAFQQEKEAMKKLENVRKDHYQRLEALEKTQEVDKQKAELITRNQQLVDNAILAIQSILANQVRVYSRLFPFASICFCLDILDRHSDAY